MRTWIALLRGINVGGKQILPMKALVALLAQDGIAGARTHIQSGNLVFRCAGTSATALAGRIGTLIRADRGFEPRVLVLSAADLAAAIAANPFRAAADDPATLHLFFLDAVPRSANIDALNRLRAEREAFALEGRVFYLHTPDGLGGSRLGGAVERHLGVAATARNWRTVSTLLEMADDHP